MKKILSLFLAVAVLLISCSSVFAAVNYYQDGGYWLIEVSTVPDIGDYASVTPTVSITPTKLDLESDVQAAFGRSGKNSLPVADYDVYKLDVTLSNLGELINGISEDDKVVNAGIVGVGIQIAKAQADSIKAQYINGSQITGGTFDMGKDSVTGVLNITWAAAAVKNPYPYVNQSAEPYEVSYQEDGTMSFSLGVGITKGATVNFSNVATRVLYRTQYHETGSETYTNSNAAPVSFSLPPSGGGGEDPETYIVAFVDWDDTPIASGDDYEEGDSVTAPADPTRIGWTFTGWSDGTETYAGNAIPAVGNDNVTYTATYSQNNYTITFNDWDDSEISSDSTYVYGATVTPPANPTRSGYTFTGWTPAVATVTGDAVYTATYSKDPVYAESISIEGYGLTNVSTTVQLTYETEPDVVDDTVAWEIVSGPATINDSGLVTPTDEGVVVVQITASPSGATATHTIKVVADPVAPTVEETNLYLTKTELVEKKYDDGNYYHVSDATISSADTTNYIYKAWAREYGSEEKHYFELPEDIDAVNEFLNVEAYGAALNFILMIKSASHKIIAAGIDAFLDK